MSLHTGKMHPPLRNRIHLDIQSTILLMVLVVLLIAAIWWIVAGIQTWLQPAASVAPPAQTTIQQPAVMPVIVLAGDWEGRIIQARELGIR